MLADLHRPCPLCGNTEPEVLAQLTLPQPSHSPLPSGYRLVACAACDFTYADTPAAQADYDHYYQQLAKYGGPTGTGAGQNPADQQRLEQLADRLENLLPGKDAAILDIGCGAGGLLQALHTRGYTRAEGLDPDPAAVADGVGEWFEVLVNRDIDLNDVGKAVRHLDGTFVKPGDVDGWRAYDTDPDHVRMKVELIKPRLAQRTALQFEH